jgi:hypothetical protein
MMNPRAGTPVPFGAFFMADKKAILLRIPQDLWEHLNRWARSDLRSVNAQIEFLLREAVQRRTGRVPDKPHDRPRSQNEGA